MDKSYTSPAIHSLIVLVNPLAGDGDGQIIYDESVAPIFAQHNLSTRVIQTAYAGHCFEIVQQTPLTDLQNVKALVIVSGDGLVSEVFNGLMRTCPPLHRASD